MLRLGTLTVDPPLVLAPMAGVTDRDFRLIVRRIGGVGLVSMEFISARALVRGERQTTRLLAFSDEERPLAIQIYGSDVETMVEAARQVEELAPDVCDINMGCPANKVLKGCAGAALMGDLGLAERVIAGVRAVLSIPLTVKFRLGLDENRLNYLELGRICEANGADAVAMHARTARQKFSGEADWSHIARLKEALSIPVLGNGDVRTAKDAVQRFAESGCDGLLVARGATRNPWIFHEIAARLSGGKIAPPTLENRRALILDHFSTVVEREDPRFALHKLRTFTGLYSHGLANGRELRRQISELPDIPAFFRAIERFFDKALERAA